MLSSSPVLSAYYIANNLGPESGHCDLTMLEASQADGQSHLLTKPRSIPQDDIPSSHANHHYMDRKRMVTEPMDPNQHSFESPLQNESPLHNDTNDINPSSLPPGLPPVIGHLSCYANRASTKFMPKLSGGNKPTALEHRFLTKNILKRDEADISLMDIQQVCLPSLYCISHELTSIVLG